MPRTPIPFMETSPRALQHHHRFLQQYAARNRRYVHFRAFAFLQHVSRRQACSRRAQGISFFVHLRPMCRGRRTRHVKGHANDPRDRTKSTNTYWRDNVSPMSRWRLLWGEQSPVLHEWLPRTKKLSGLGRGGDFKSASGVGFSLRMCTTQKPRLQARLDRTKTYDFLFE